MSQRRYTRATCPYCSRPEVCVTSGGRLTRHYHRKVTVWCDGSGLTLHEAQEKRAFDERNPKLREGGR